MGLAGGAGLFRVSQFSRTAADALFFAGGAILTVGALLEFLYKAGSPRVGRAMMAAYGSLSCHLRFVDVPDVAPYEESRSGGWMLIFIGALLIAASLAFAFLVMK